jgi:hypothetical protein
MCNTFPSACLSEISQKTIRPLYLCGLGRNSWPLTGLAQTRRQLEAGTVNAWPSSGRSSQFTEIVSGSPIN